jgi:hypothetical protein
MHLSTRFSSENNRNSRPRGFDFRVNGTQSLTGFIE